jgi:hypothetical protein
MILTELRNQIYNLLEQDLAADCRDCHNWPEYAEILKEAGYLPFPTPGSFPGFTERDLASSLGYLAGVWHFKLGSRPRLWVRVDKDHGHWGHYQGWDPPQELARGNDPESLRRVLSR